MEHKTGSEEDLASDITTQPMWLWTVCCLTSLTPRNLPQVNLSYRLVLIYTCVGNHVLLSLPLFPESQLLDIPANNIMALGRREQRDPQDRSL